MALNIKNERVEDLAHRVSERTGESLTAAVGIALEERLRRVELSQSDLRRQETLRAFLVSEVWPQVPEDVLDRPVSRRRAGDLLDRGPDGY